MVARKPTASKPRGEYVNNLNLDELSGKNPWEFVLQKVEHLVDPVISQSQDPVKIHPFDGGRSLDPKITVRERGFRLYPTTSKPGRGRK